MLPWISQKNMSVAVLGDLIVDEYLSGDVTRISPEAPVPVCLVTESFCSAGGAANTALNVQCLGAQATLFSVTGCDSSSDQLISLLEDKGVETVSFLTATAVIVPRFDVAETVTVSALFGARRQEWTPLFFRW